MIEVKNLRKTYDKLMALGGLNMSVNKGDIYGFIGPNGAGKSTTFKILATILIPDSGMVRIDNIPITAGGSIRGIIGYMPDSFGVYEDMTVYQYLDFFGAAYYIPSKKRKKLIGDILDLTDLAFKRDAMVQSLSRGMQQRLGVARVLVHDPKLLILDEPASGLDPRARIELRELLRELAKMDKTILISSHILSELSEICTRVGIIEQGLLVFEGTREELNAKLRGGSNVTIETHPDDVEQAQTLLQSADFTSSVDRENGRIILGLNQDCEEVERVPALLIEKGIRLRRFQPADMSLEQAFMHLTEGKLA